jgi:hypothetical protein
MGWTVPCFDLGERTSDPELALRLIYQLDPSAALWTEVSLDGGARFEVLGDGDSGIGWYDALPDGGERTMAAWGGSSGPADVWREARHRLIGAAGRRAVLVRFALRSGTVTGPRYGVGIDDVAIRD